MKNERITKVTRNGNSLTFVVPRKYYRENKWLLGDIINVTLDNNDIIVTKDPIDSGPVWKRKAQRMGKGGLCTSIPSAIIALQGIKPGNAFNVEEDGPRLILRRVPDGENIYKPEPPAGK